MSEIKMRPAVQDDCADVYRWRNDEATRRVSFSSTEISFDDHQKWFQKSLADPKRELLIVEAEGRKIGLLRFDRLNEFSREVGINLAPEMRGQGFGAKVLAAIPMTDLLIARAKTNNIGSIKAFKKAGFKELFDYQNKVGEQIQVLAKAKEPK
ncbi:MAG: GNAT family N-acetyltransferase [Candidatus Margulisbacteria bacterium]|nr:GNAT family N-acetyltransferase [Candidatus Margulisiibacteriota bacterium]